MGQLPTRLPSLLSRFRRILFPGVQGRRTQRGVRDATGASCHQGDVCTVGYLMTRILQRDNFGRSGDQAGYDEHFLLWSMSPEDAAKIVAILNAQGDEYAPYYYLSVVDGYKLVKFEP